VSEYILGVFKSFSHFCIGRFKSVTQRKGLSLTLLVYVSNESTFRIQKNLSVILEVHLHYLVAEAEHYGMLSSHPLLNIDMWIHLKVFTFTSRVEGWGKSGGS
jgi:hypothetical protein